MWQVFNVAASLLTGLVVPPFSRELRGPNEGFHAVFVCAASCSRLGVSPGHLQTLTAIVRALGVLTGPHLRAVLGPKTVTGVLAEGNKPRELHFLTLIGRPGLDWKPYEKPA
jgi:hypothetical protein